MQNIVRRSGLVVLFVLGIVGVVFPARADQPPEILYASAPASFIIVGPVTNSEIFANASVCDPAGNLYVTGSFMGLATFGTNVLSSNGGFANDDMYVVKYDPTGNVLWAKRAGGADKDYGRAITLDGTGGIFVAGTSGSQPFTIGTNSYNNNGGRGIFLAHYDGNGNVLWAQWSGALSVFQSATMTVNSLAHDSLGNVILAGSFFGNPTIGNALSPTPITLTNKALSFYANSAEDLLLAKFAPNGALLWATNYGGTNTEYATSVAVDSTGAIYAAGSFVNFTVLGTQTYTNIADGILLAKFSSAGDLVWSSNLSDPTNNNTGAAWAVAVDALDRVNLNFQFDDTAFHSVGFRYKGFIVTNSVFTTINVLAQFDVDGNPLWVKRSPFGGGSAPNGAQYQRSKLSNLALDQQNNLYLGSAGASIFKCNSAGLPLWTNTIPASPVGVSPGMAAVSVDDSYLTHVSTTIVGDIGTYITVGWTNVYPGFGGFGQDQLIFTMASNFVAVPPMFVQQPTNMIYQPPKGLTNNSLARAWPAPNYYWYMNTNKLKAQTNFFLALGPTGFTNQTSYFVVASNSYGMATSIVVNAQAGLSFATPPPTNINVLIGTNLAITGIGAGTTPVTYQWKFKNTNILNATSATLALPDIATNQGGSYTLVISNATGVLTSTPPTVVNVVLPGFIDPSFTNYYTGGLDLLRTKDGGFYVARSAVYHINSASAVDSTGAWTGSGGVGTTVLLRESDAKFLMGGTFAGGVIRVNTNGSVDTTFNAGVGPSNSVEGASFSLVETMLRLGNGQYLVAGRFTSFNGVAATNVVRLNTNGSVDLTFQRHVISYSSSPIQGVGAIHKLALQADGKILAGGEFAFVDGASVSNLFRMNPDGTIDPSFAATAVLKVPPFGRVQTLLPLADGRILAGGAWGNSTNTGVVRLNTNGVLDATFQGPATTAPTYAITLLASNKLILGGQNFLTRTTFDGATDPLFSVGSTFNSSQTYAMVLEPSGNLVIAGTYGIKRLWLEPSPVVVPTFSSGSGVAVVNGQMQFSACGGVEGQTIYVQASADLVNWSTVSTNIVSGGCISYTDPQLPAPPNRYYHLSTVP